MSWEVFCEEGQLNFALFRDSGDRKYESSSTQSLLSGWTASSVSDKSSAILNIWSRARAARISCTCHVNVGLDYFMCIWFIWCWHSVCMLEVGRIWKGVCPWCDFSILRPGCFLKLGLPWLLNYYIPLTQMCWSSHVQCILMQHLKMKLFFHLIPCIALWLESLIWASFLRVSVVHRFQSLEAPDHPHCPSLNLVQFGCILVKVWLPELCEV